MVPPQPRDNATENELRESQHSTSLDSYLFVVGDIEFCNEGFGLDDEGTDRGLEMAFDTDNTNADGRSFEIFSDVWKDVVRNDHVQGPVDVAETVQVSEVKYFHDGDQDFLNVVTIAEVGRHCGWSWFESWTNKNIWLYVGKWKLSLMRQARDELGVMEDRWATNENLEERDYGDLCYWPPSHQVF